MLQASDFDLIDKSFNFLEVFVDEHCGTDRNILITSCFTKLVDFVNFISKRFSNRG